MPPDQGLWPREKLAYEVSKFRKLRYFLETFRDAQQCQAARER